MTGGNYQSKTSILAIRGVCALVAMLAIGCGQNSSKPTARVRGAITIQGQAIPADAEGTILFRPTAKGMAKTASVPIVAGKYDSPETPMGEVDVYFSIQEPTGKMISEAGGPPYPEFRSIVPAEASKGVQLTVTGDRSDQDFNLE